MGARNLTDRIAPQSSRIAGRFAFLMHTSYPRHMTNSTPRVNFNVRTQANAYREGMLDAFDLLITMLEEGGSIDYLLEGIEHNARPETVARMNAFYDRRR